MAFSPDYVRLVLNENFEDAKRLFLDALLDIQYAHLVMLAGQGIVGGTDVRALRAALDGIDRDELRRTGYDGTCEDLFFHLDHLLAAACGPDVAARLHTARSRNDIDMTLYRMRQREWQLDLTGEIIALRRTLATLASRHLRTVYPVHTHTQPAQPSTVAHYLLAVIEQLERDTTRLLAAHATTNRSPLGACAITGTGFPIDRQRTSDLLGFDGPTGNTYGSIATVDYVLEGAAAAGIALVGIGRFVQDMLLWCTVEMGFLRLPDAFVQGSSIMPQKRNPVALEHARALASKAFAQAAAIPLAIHNTPFGDIVDTEDDLQPIVASMYHDARRAVALMAASMAGAEVAVAHMRQRATAHWITITELADTLARVHDVPFGVAHAIAGRLVRERMAAPAEPLSPLIERLSKDATGHGIRLPEDEIARMLSPEYFVDVRRTPGGPSPEVVAAALDEALARIAADDETCARRRGAAERASARLRDAVAAL